MAFLEVLTRVYKRPAALAVNQASLLAQTDDDWMQTLLVDPVGAGIPASHERLADQAPELTGDYIWVLDDDDECIRPELVAELKAIAKAHEPNVIMMRMDCGPRGVLPDDGHWGLPPVEGRVASACFVVRRDLWQACADDWRSGRYAGDYDFIAAVFETTARVHWHDVIAARVQSIGLGRPEAKSMKVKAIRSFVGKGPDGIKYRAAVGDILELPDWSDWIRAGLVVPVEDDAPETAATQPAETAAKPKARKRG